MNGYPLALLALTAAALTVIFAAAKRPAYSVPAAGLLALLIMAACAGDSIDPLRSLLGRHGTWTNGVWPAALLLALTGAAPLSTEWLWLAGCALALHAGLQLWGVVPAALQAGRAGSLLGNPVDLGAVLAMACGVAPVYALPVLGLGLLAAGSRGAILAGAVAALSAAWGWKLTAKERALGAAAVVALVLLVGRAHRPTSDAPRWIIWRTALQAGAARPLMGQGPDTFEYALRRRRGPDFAAAAGSDSVLQGYAHNDLLEAWATCGIMGLLAYAVLAPALLASPPLLALFLIMKFNPVGLIPLCVAALLMSGGERVRLRWPALILGVLSVPLLTVLWIARLSPGDLAQRLLPWESAHAIRAYNSGVFSTELADRLVRWHPLDPHARYARALMAIRVGDEARGRSEIRAAHELDREYGPIKRLYERVINNRAVSEVSR